jgi:hypothetical protein
MLPVRSDRIPLRWLGAWLSALTLLSGTAEGHLFHQVYEVPDNQLTKDYVVLLRLIEFPDENFALAEQVYRGEQRVRLKPGGLRSWLRRPLEPGMVFKADYQLHRWTGSLAGEAKRLDHTYGTAFDRRLEAGFRGRHAEAVKTALREMFFYLMRELFEALWLHLEKAEAPWRLYGFLGRYFSVSQEAFLNLNHRARYVVLRAVLDAVERTLGDADRGIPPAPEVFQQQRVRFLRTLGEVLQVA